jgi:hypothetical protein
MRLTPAQIAVELLCGSDLPPFVRQIEAIEDRIVEGRRQLASIAGVDFGYDLQRWHDHLKVSRQGGYTWNRTIALPKVMQAAIKSEKWHAAVRKLADSVAG